uniref:NADH dehydrogenase [ubiquinone] 1 alpha subcomplex assembly factor 2 n=2 Tax=Catharus ustulatus TaxID=91951 RepID=A0A8C3U7S6_CATUS
MAGGVAGAPGSHRRDRGGRGGAAHRQARGGGAGPGCALPVSPCPWGAAPRPCRPDPGMSRTWQALRALRLRLLGPAKELVGTDQFGNKYYRVPKHESRAGQIIPERRFVEAVNREAYQYQIGDFPAEWEAWIRKKREDPPTIEEILRNENYREEIKQKAKDVSEKDKLLQAKEYEQGLIAEPSHTQVKGHASAPYYGKKEPSQDPTSTANTFQPGAWMPPGSGNSQNK